MTPDEATKPRLLILEFVTRERWVFDSRYFPFVKGCADWLGFPARWLCYGATVSIEKTGEMTVHQSVDLDGAELALLSRHVDELAPTHVMSSHPLGARIMQVLERSGSVTALLQTSDHPTPDMEDVTDYTRRVMASHAVDLPARLRPSLEADCSTAGLQSRTDWLLHWFGMTPETSADFGRYIVGTIAPAYDAVMANDTAVDARPHLLALGGIACDHAAPVRRNPHYAGLDLADCEQDYGCAFCTWYRGPTSDLHADVVDTAIAQLQRIAETAGAEGSESRYQGVVDLLDVRVFLAIERFARAVVALDLPPTRFCFEPRVDRFLRVEEKLDRALGILAEKGHSVCLFRMGMENLSEAENELFNKQMTLAQIDAGTTAMRAMSERHPGVFEYDRTWGYITCSPWTTLEHFEEQIVLAMERNFDPLGVWMYTPLLLFRSAPIVRLAERAGDVLVDEFDDLSLLYSSSVNGIAFDTLIPWRFQDARMGAAFALTVRFCAAGLRDKYSDGLFVDDPRYAQLLARQDALPDVRWDRADIFALEVIRRLLDGAATDVLEPLLDEALAAYPEARSEAGDVRVPTDAGGDDGPAEGDVTTAAPLAEAVATVLASTDALSAIRLISTARVPDEDAVAVRVEIEGTGYELRLSRAGVPAFHTGRHLAVGYVNATPLTSRDHQRLVRDLLGALERLAGDTATRLVDA